MLKNGSLMVKICEVKLIEDAMSSSAEFNIFFFFGVGNERWVIFG